MLVQLPGRHDRRPEQPFTRIDPLVEALVEALEAEGDGRPCAFFGHSMGAMLAYRLSVTLQRDGIPGPVLLGVSSWAPAGSFVGAREFSGLPDAERADLSVLSDYVADGAVVSCPVAAYGGKSDPLLVPGAMALWTTRSLAFLGVREFPGGHFYLDEHAVAVADDLARHLQQQLTRHGSA